MIGETWINLEEVIRRGGGQSDAWHELNAKGKYAGQIRIELTYYDTRPKEDRAATVAPQSYVSAAAQDDTPHTAGPRELGTKRRPLPSTNGQHTASIEQFPANSIPAPLTQPRSYHTPPPQNPTSNMNEQAEQEEFDTRGAYDAHTEALMHAQHVEPHHGRPQTFAVDGSMLYNDDPHALQAVQHEADPYNAPHMHGVPPLRHDRIQRLSNAGPVRPGPQGGLPHAYSDPILSHTTHLASTVNAPFSPEWHDLRQPLPYGSQQAQGGSMGSVDHWAPVATSKPPPPPVHRNSAPSTHRLSARVQTLQSNVHSQQPMHNAEPPPHSYDCAVTTRLSEPETDRFSRNPQYDSQFRSGQSPQPQPSHDRDGMARAHRESFQHDNSLARASLNSTTPLFKPQAMSPGATQRPQTNSIQRKSVSPRPAQMTPYENGTTSVPFSPDSFATFNPMAQQASSTKTPFDDAREPTPMYSSRQGSTEPGSVRPLGNERAPMSASAPTTAPALGPEAPIRDSRGRIVDPSDHLPSSTFAPEPEPKGSDRARVGVSTASSRFGPREARHSAGAPMTGDLSTSPSPASTPLAPVQTASPRNGRLQKRQPPVGGYVNSTPLAPSPATALNSGVRNLAHGYAQQRPPPVPGKVPLDAQSYPYEQEHGRGYEYAQEKKFETTDTLSQEMSRIDIGLSPLQKFEKRFGPVAGGGAQRGQRRSRFGP